MKSLLFLATTTLATATPEITTIAGNGQPASSGDGGPATAAALHDPFGITRGPDGNLYVCEFNGHRVRRITSDGRIETVAGTGTPGYSGDGGPATPPNSANPTKSASARTETSTSPTCPPTPSARST